MGEYEVLKRWLFIAGIIDVSKRFVTKFKLYCLYRDPMLMYTCVITGAYKFLCI